VGGEREKRKNRDAHDEKKGAFEYPIIKK